MKGMHLMLTYMNVIQFPSQFQCLCFMPILVADVCLLCLYSLSLSLHLTHSLPPIVLIFVLSYFSQREMELSALEK